MVRRIEWSEESNGQKVMAFSGVVLGSWFGARHEAKQEGLGSLFGKLKLTPEAQLVQKDKL